MAKRGEKITERGRRADCTECNASMKIEDFYGRGDMVFCEECGAEYVISSLRPFHLVRIEDED